MKLVSVNASKKKNVRHFPSASGSMTPKRVSLWSQKKHPEDFPASEKERVLKCNKMIYDVGIKSDFRVWMEYQGQL